MTEAFYCEKCKRTMDGNQFYGTNKIDKYPEGKLRQCKKCVWTRSIYYKNNNY